MKGQLITPAGILFLPASMTGDPPVLSLLANDKDLARLTGSPHTLETEHLVQLSGGEWVKPSAVSGVVAYKGAGDQPDRVAVLLHSGGAHVHECADWPAAQKQRNRTAKQLNKERTE